MGGLLSRLNEEKKVDIYTKDYDEETDGVLNTAGFYDYTYDYTVPASEFDQSLSQQYKITLKASNGRTTEDVKTILYDVEGPNISVTDIKPVIDNRVFEKDANGDDTKNVLSGYEKNINKKITVKGTLDDTFDNVESAEWKLYQKEDDNDPEFTKVVASGTGLKTTILFPVTLCTIMFIE